MPNVSTKQYISTLFWMLFGKSRHYSTFLFGLSVGVLVGFAISAPVLGWHLSNDASTVLSAFFGGVAGVAGAVVIWRLQERAQRESIKHLVAVCLTDLILAARNASKVFGADNHAMMAFISVDVSLRAALMDYLSVWRSLGIQQSVFDVFTSLELMKLKRVVDDLLEEMDYFDSRIKMAIPVDPDRSSTLKVQVSTVEQLSGSIQGRIQKS